MKSEYFRTAEETPVINGYKMLKGTPLIQRNDPFEQVQLLKDELNAVIN